MEYLLAKSDRQLGICLRMLYDWQHDCDIGIRTWSGSGSAVVYIDCAIDS